MVSLGNAHLMLAGPDPRLEATILQASTLILTVTSMLWSGESTSFMLRVWFPNITSLLLSDIRQAGDRIVQTQAAAVTLLSVIVNLVVLLVAHKSPLLNWQVILVTFVLSLCTLGFAFCLWRLPLMNQEKYMGKGVVSYRYAVWIVIISANVIVLTMIWTL
jgi:hypothetical protein